MILVFWLDFVTWWCAKNHEIFKVVVFEFCWLESVTNACRMRSRKFGIKTKPSWCGFEFLKCWKIEGFEKNSWKFETLANPNETWWAPSWYYYGMDWKKSRKNTVSRYVFPFFPIFHISGLWKNKKNTSPCRKILIFCRQCCTIFMRIPAKNLVKIRSLGPKTELMSTQKKCIYLYKSGFCIFSYYRGGVFLNAASSCTMENSGAVPSFPPVLACFVVGQVKTPTHGWSTNLGWCHPLWAAARWWPPSVPADWPGGKKCESVMWIFVARWWDFRCVAHF